MDKSLGLRLIRKWKVHPVEVVQETVVEAIPRHTDEYVARFPHGRCIGKRVENFRDKGVLIRRNRCGLNSGRQMFGILNDNSKRFCSLGRDLQQSRDCPEEGAYLIRAALTVAVYERKKTYGIEPRIDALFFFWGKAGGVQNPPTL